MLNWFYRWCDGVRHRRRLRSGNQAHAMGRRGEDLAHRHLQTLGYVVVARNYRTPSGSAEIDLVAWDRDILVFVEVKTRATDEFGSPDRAVDQRKRRHILQAADDYQHRAVTQTTKTRFDVVSVVLREGEPELTGHTPDAFHPDGDNSQL